MIIGITGKIGAGKSTIAQHLVEAHGFTRLGFADTLKSMALVLNPLIPCETWMFGQTHVPLSAYVKEWGMDLAKKNPEVRRFFQVLGTEGVRQHLGEDSWIRALQRRIEDTEADGPPRFVVDDVRFLNEAQAIRDWGGEIWRVVRPGFAGDGHVSETEQDRIEADWTFFNDGSMESHQLLLAYHVAQVLQVDESTVRRWAAEGRLPAIRLGPGAVRFDPDEIERWLEERRTGR